MCFRSLLPWLSPILLWLILGNSLAEAEPLDLQRTAFRAAEKALKNADRAVVDGLKASLKGYPLYPYLLYHDLGERLADAPAREVRAFLDTYADSPITDRLRARWLRHLFSTGRWQDFLHDYRAGDDTAMDCRYRQALLHTGHEEQALRGIETVWMSGTSLPNVCDPVFGAWKSRGGFTRERIWRRFGLALQAGQPRLARYLLGLLPPKDRPFAELWLEVHANPRLILESHRFDPSHPRTAAIILHGLNRWSGIDSVGAAAAFDRVKDHYRLPADEVDRLARKLALYVASRGHPDALARLTALPPAAVDEAVAAWRVRVAGLQRQDWHAALEWLGRMPPKQADEPQWRYWRARALALTGREAEARTLYQKLAEERDYYGFLAADRLGLPYRLGHAPLKIPPEALNELPTRLVGLQRARELFFLGREWQARMEWNHAIQDLNADDLKTAASLAHSWGWHDRAIVTLARTGYWDDLDIRFPLPHRDRVLISSRDEAIDPAWVYAVMRQESIFRPDAKSSAGALGLMQILPATGRRIAQRLQTSLSGHYALLEADTNIRYGAHYLRYTLDRLQANPVLATAAYNAGPHRVMQWLPEHELIEADLWIELIPFFETRQYVKRVMEYATIYDHRLGREGTSLQARMRAILPADAATP